MTPNAAEGFIDWAERSNAVDEIQSNPATLRSQELQATLINLLDQENQEREKALQFLHQFRQYFLGFSLHWALSFCPLRFLFLLHARLAILLQGSISLSTEIAPLSALITA